MKMNYVIAELDIRKYHEHNNNDDVQCKIWAH